MVWGRNPGPVWMVLAAVLSAAGSANCDDDGSSSAARASKSATTIRAAPTPQPVRSAPEPSARSSGAGWRFPAAERVVAFGDVHGDFAATLEVLQSTGLIDRDRHWVGGKTVAVQTGDQLDRGDGERPILDLFQRLTNEAANAGGAFLPLNGNHEYMNALGDLRYVTDGGFSAFPSDGEEDLTAGRRAAFTPGGPFARVLAERNTVVIVGDSVFAHGGVEPEYVDRLGDLNAAAKRWLAGSGSSAVARELMQPNSPVWSRRYSQSHPSADDCKALSDVLDRLGVVRMVVGHTVQRDGVTSACDDKVWRVDVGMATHYGGKPAALEITAAGVSVLGPF